jgi:hypothetical protein
MHLFVSLPPLVPVAASAASPQQKAVAEEFAVIARRVWARDAEGAVRPLTSEYTAASKSCNSHAYACRLRAREMPA